MADDLKQIDLYLTRRDADLLVFDRECVDLRISASGDLSTTTGRANLIQSILNRLFTRKGELKKLGHPHYGSRLHKLIGELNNARTRVMAELYIRESLAQESRIKEITRIILEPASRDLDRDMLKVTIAIRPIGHEGELTFVIPINLGA